MDPFANRTYRDFAPRGTVAFRVTIGQSDLFIRADADYSREATAALNDARAQIEGYGRAHPEFFPSMRPLPEDPHAPQLIRQMLAAGRAAGVGPMAAVAGVVSEHVGRALRAVSRQVIVENGGDLYLALTADQVVGVFAGGSPFSGKLGLRIAASSTPGGLCTSSGTVGPSHSDGVADAVAILARDTALADAVATAAGNRVHGPGDVQAALDFARAVPGVAGACVIINDQLGVWGELELVPTAARETA